MINCRSHVTVSSVQRNVSRWLSSPTPVLLCLFLAILGQVLPPPPSPAVQVPGPLGCCTLAGHVETACAMDVPKHFSISKEKKILFQLLFLTFNLVFFHCMYRPASWPCVCRNCNSASYE